jgi:hypothetical protein
VVQALAERRRSSERAAESVALKSLLRLAYAFTHERGDVYVASTFAGASGPLRLEAWAREVDATNVEARVSPKLRAEAVTAAYELRGRLAIEADAAGRRVIFRIDAPRR